jgi:hypothetical protein
VKVGGWAHQKVMLRPAYATDLITHAVWLYHVRRAVDGSSLPVVRSCDIEAVVAAWSGVPVERLTEDEMTKLVRLVSWLHMTCCHGKRRLAAMRVCTPAACLSASSYGWTHASTPCGVCMGVHVFSTQCLQAPFPQRTSAGLAV